MSTATHRPPRDTLLGAARTLLAAAAVLAVAGCSAPLPSYGPAIGYSFVEPIYSPGEVGYAADGRDLRVVVRGNPFAERGVSDDRLGAAVTAAMQGAPGWFVTNFTRNPGDSAREIYRVVWLIGVAQNTSIYRICGGPAGGISIGGYNIGGSEAYDEDAPLAPGDTVLAAFCRRERMMSYLRADLGDIAAPDDPRFDSLIKTATRVLFPRLDPNRDGRSREDLDM